MNKIFSNGFKIHTIKIPNELDKFIETQLGGVNYLPSTVEEYIIKLLIKEKNSYDERKQ
jgi:hypothetical protein